MDGSLRKIAVMDVCLQLKAIGASVDPWSHSQSFFEANAHPHGYHLAPLHRRDESLCCKDAPSQGSESVAFVMTSAAISYSGRLSSDVIEVRPVLL